MSKTAKLSWLGLFVWSIGVLFYVYECFLRVFPNTISDNLIDGLKINAEQYSLIGSSFFLIYACMQIPVGYCIDRIGVKLSLIGASIIAALGLLWFSFAHSLSNAIITRFFMGFGAAFGYIAILSLALNWFPKKHFGFFSGLSQFLGSVGPILAGAPFALILHQSGGNWRAILFTLSLIGFALTVLIAFFVKNKPPSATHIIHIERSSNQGHKVMRLLKNVKLWFIVLYTAGIYGSMPILGTFWGVLFLQARGLAKTKAALLSSLIWVGYAVGSPIIGKLSDQTRRRLPWIRITALLGAVSTVVLLFAPIKSDWVLGFVFICIGLSATGQSLGVALMAESVYSHVQTTMMGLNNMVVMLFGAIIPSISGAIIHTANHVVKDGVTYYSEADFVKGLVLMPILYVIAFLLSIFGIKETFCRSQFEVIHPGQQGNKPIGH